MRTPLYPALLAALLLLVVKLGCNSETIKQALPIGSPCAQSSECGTQPTFACDLTRPGGYCQKDCKSDFDCPSEGVCVFDGGDLGTCRQRCDTANNCRFSSGYLCRPTMQPSAGSNIGASHAYCDAPASGGPDGGGDGSASDAAPRG